MYHKRHMFKLNNDNQSAYYEPLVLCYYDAIDHSTAIKPNAMILQL